MTDAERKELQDKLAEIIYPLLVESNKSDDYGIVYIQVGE